jgi:hypothetical protein
MKMKIKYLIVIAILSFIVIGTASAFDIQLSNPTDKVVSHAVVWETCDWVGWRGRCTIGMGEQSPGSNHRFGNNYKPGIYSVNWYNRAEGYDDTYVIEIKQRSGLLILEARKKPMFAAGS